MEIPHVRVPGVDERIDPKLLLEKIEYFNREVGSSFRNMLTSLTQVQDEIRRLDELKEVSKVAEHMLRSAPANSRAEAEVELENINQAIEHTVSQLQKLDQEMPGESVEANQLALHLELISRENERSRHQVLEKLAGLIEDFVSQDRALQQIETHNAQRLAADRDCKKNVDQFMARLEEGGDEGLILQEALDVIALMGQQISHTVSGTEQAQQLIELTNTRAQESMGRAFDIRSILESQEITHQKVDRVIDLLNKMQLSLLRLSQTYLAPSDPSNPLEIEETDNITFDLENNADIPDIDAHASDWGNNIRQSKNN